ncbi:MAG: TRAP transporter large permease [Thermincola sp.]|jgi:tripartite ATP-independent transporter DctM subunit|nr:TRAP transporter large permease [Thermincola sp.]MDT3703017.1 TRAP transporter large permease [Thermincola sp.]
MSPEMVGILGIIVMLILFAIGMPIAFAMALAGVAGYANFVSPTVGLSLLPRDIFEQFASYPLSVIPMFVLMGTYAFASGIGKKLFETANTLVGHLPGGLAMATIAASAGFGAICGSTTATCATIGKIAIPEMKRFGYKDWISTGTVAVSGGLGIMIPPSTSFIVFGLLTEQSIGKLFIAGIIPGIILAILMMGTVYYLCRRDSAGASIGQSATLKQKLISLKGLTDTIILFFITIGGLFAGWFTPTQAGAIGAAGAIMIGLLNRELTWQKFVEATKDGLRLSCMIMLLIAGATVFSHFITRTGMPLKLAEWVGTLDVSPAIIMLLIVAFWFVLGCFIDAMAIIVLLVPILMPVITNLGYDLTWFAVIVTALSMIAVVTPPVGVNAFVVKGITKDVPLTTIFRGIIPFLIPLIVGTLLLIAFPGLSTFLPKYITY